NAFNRQNWEFFVITDMDYIAEVAEVSWRHLGGEVSDHKFFGAPLVIMITDERGHRTPFQDAGCAMENMFIAAQSMGLGSVWVNQFMTIEDEPDVIEVLKKIGIEPERHVTAIGAFGFPDMPPRDKQITSKVHYVRGH
ncbi:MAG: nitroreductase family protein, partial [Oscillospiraceae bacterium]